MSRQTVTKPKRTQKPTAENRASRGGGGKTVATIGLATGAAVVATLVPLASGLAAEGQSAAAIAAVVAIVAAILGALAVAGIYIWRQG